MAISDWADMMQSEFTIDSLASYNEYGEPSYTPDATPLKGRFFYKREIVRNKMNEEVVAKGCVWTTTTLEEEIHIHYKGEVLRFVAVEKIDDENGFHHSKAWFI